MVRALKAGRRETATVVLISAMLLLCAYGLDTALCSLSGLPSAMALRGALMVVGWGVMMPTGAIVARYFKVTPRQNFPTEYDNPFWWRWHRVLQYGGVALSTVATVVILSMTGGHVGTLHGALGLCVMMVCWMQVASATLRGSKGGPTDACAVPHDPTTWRGDHYDMTPRRRLFETWHKKAGWAVVVLAAATMLLGIDLVGSPPWLVLLAGVLQGGAVLAILDGRLRRRWVDTYLALWGHGHDPQGAARRSIN